MARLFLALIPLLSFGAQAREVPICNASTEDAQVVAVVWQERWIKGTDIVELHPILQNASGFALKRGECRKANLDNAVLD